MGLFEIAHQQSVPSINVPGLIIILKFCFFPSAPPIEQLLTFLPRTSALQASQLCLVLMVFDGNSASSCSPHCYQACLTLNHKGWREPGWHFHSPHVHPTALFGLQRRKYYVVLARTEFFEQQVVQSPPSSLDIFVDRAASDRQTSQRF